MTHYYKVTLCRINHWIGFIAGLILLALPSVVHGQESTQNSSHSSTTIFDVLSSNDPQEGTVSIRQPLLIQRMVGKATRHTSSMSEHNGSKEGHGYTVRRKGYRVQLYTGNMAGSKTEAYRRARLVASTFPTERSYVVYNAPFWRLVVGNYTSHEEAQAALSRFRTAFPQFSSEIYIVRDKIISQ